MPEPQSSCCLNERPRDHCLHHCKLDRLSSCHPWHYALLKQRSCLINPLHVWHTPAVSEPSETHNRPSFHPSINQQHQPQTEPQPQPTTNNNKQLHMFEHIGVALSVWYHPCSLVMVFNQSFCFRDWKLTTWQPHITISHLMSSAQLYHRDTHCGSEWGQRHLATCRMRGEGIEPSGHT